MPTSSQVCSRLTARQFFFFLLISSVSGNIAAVFCCWVFFLGCIQTLFYTSSRTLNEHHIIVSLLILARCEPATSKAAGMQRLHSCTAPWNRGYTKPATRALCCEQSGFAQCLQPPRSSTSSAARLHEHLQAGVVVLGDFG